jgi:cytochrome c-type biogenesis protein CcmF
VHSFASDPERGLFVLLILGSFAFGSLTLFAVRAAKLEDKTEFNLISREGSVLINNLLLSVACFTVILGTIYPLIYTLLTNQQISVGAPYFNVTFGITMIITLFFLAISTDLKWRQSNLKIFLSTKWLANLLFAIIAACFFAQLLNNSSIITLMGIGISFFAIAAMLELLVLRIKLFKVSLNETIKLLIALPASFYAMWLAHIAVALVTFAIIMSNNLQQEKTALLAVGEKMKIAGYEIDLQHIDYGQGANYLFRRAKLYVTNLKGDEISNLYPEVRFYPVENNQTTESAIYSTWIADLYATIGDEDMVAKKIMVKIHYKPCIKLLWFSLLLIVVAAIIPAAIRQLKLT